MGARPSFDNTRAPVVEVGRRGGCGGGHVAQKAPLDEAKDVAAYAGGSPRREAAALICPVEEGIHRGPDRDGALAGSCRAREDRRAPGHRLLRRVAVAGEEGADARQAAGDGVGEGLAGSTLGAAQALLAPIDRAQAVADLLLGNVCAGQVGLVDHVDIGDLEQSGLDRLDAVAEAGHRDREHAVGRRGDLDVGLSGADRLQDDAAEPVMIEHGTEVRDGGDDPAHFTPHRHAAEVDARAARRFAHAHPVAEHRAAREGTPRVGGDDGDLLAGPRPQHGEPAHEGGLTGTGRPGDAENRGPRRRAIGFGQDLRRLRRLVLDGAQPPGEAAAGLQVGRHSAVPSI